MILLIAAINIAAFVSMPTDTRSPLLNISRKWLAAGLIMLSCGLAWGQWG